MSVRVVFFGSARRLLVEFFGRRGRRGARRRPAHTRATHWLGAHFDRAYSISLREHNTCSCKRAASALNGRQRVRARERRRRASGGDGGDTPKHPSTDNTHQERKRDGSGDYKIVKSVGRRGKGGVILHVRTRARTTRNCARRHARPPPSAKSHNAAARRPGTKKSCARPGE